jgi:ABC-type amino acid transport system permease subunit
MTVTEAAYMAEIHRGGLLSVAKGQSEAGHALRNRAQLNDGDVFIDQRRQRDAKRLRNNN